jgi:hypothetical protein
MMKKNVAVLWLVMGCGSLENAAGPTFPTAHPPDPAAEYLYCQRIGNSARVRAAETAGWGYGLTVLGVGSTTVGTAIPLSKSDELQFKHKMGVAGLMAGGIVLYIIGEAFLKRSDAASKLASEVNNILGERVEDPATKKRGPIARDEAAAKCTVALGAWEASRADATALASKLREKDRAEKEAAQQEAATEKKKSTDLKKMIQTCVPPACNAPDLLKMAP